MIFFLSEFIPILLSPLVALGALIAASLIFKRRALGLVSLALLWLLSLPVASNSIWQLLEGSHRVTSPQLAPTASAIVVLGGMTALIEGRAGYVREWEEGADRFWGGVELFKAGRAPLLVFTGGRMPWSPVKETEGEWLAALAQRVGIPAERVRVSAEARNTAQEAAAVSALIKSRDILLVTSAFHMPRAQKIFEREGFRVIPFPVDARVRADPTRWSDFLPSAQALRRSADALREWIGRAFYGAW